MDDIVKQALAKWPNVPDCYGWLGLDARGLWYMRDDRAQAAGAFASGQRGAKGSLLRHDKLIAFIERNYEADPRGRWFFQNGPQRVYVELEATPVVWRLHGSAAAPEMRAHDGRAAQASECLLDEDGRLYLAAAELAANGKRLLGLVHTQDMLLAAEAVEAGAWTPEALQAADLPARYGYVRSPAADASAAHA
ncbi:MAG TPA: DUF2946 family protein [Burkholderiaceae bacterium]|nr:DUF2946 family protein [Burkholderiaceae bacterium]